MILTKSSKYGNTLYNLRKKNSWPKRVFNSFINSLSIINGLKNTGFFESLYSGFTLYLHLFIQINNPPDVERFQIWQLRCYIDISRVFYFLLIDEQLDLKTNDWNWIEAFAALLTVKSNGWNFQNKMFLECHCPVLWMFP